MSWKDITPSLCLQAQRLKIPINKNKLPRILKTFLLLTLILSNDIHQNPGPIKYPCAICDKSVNSNHRAVSCDNCQLWVHIKCGNISPEDYNKMSKCENITWSCPNCKIILTGTTIEQNKHTEPIVNSKNNSLNTSSTSTGSDRSEMNNENDKGLLTILTMNCRSLRSEAKRNMLQTIIETHEPHIVHLQETHLDKTISTAEILDPEQYEIVRKDRITEKGHEGGGIINAVRKNIVCNGEDTLDTNCEIGWTKIQLKGCKALYTGCYYRKPDNDPTPLQNLNTSISRLTHNNTLPNIILTGDFNLPDIDWDEEDSNGGYTIKSSHNYSNEINKLALDIVEEHCLQQCVTEPTREKNILDLVLTTNENLVQKMSITDGMSDHQMIITTVNARPKVIKNKPRKVYQYKKGNMEKVQEYLNSKYENFKEKITEMNIEEYWTLFKTHLFQAMDLHIPSKNLTSRFNLPWVNQHIKKMIRKKERLYKVAKKYQTKEHWDKFKQYRKAVKTELDISHKKYIFDMLEVSPSTSEASTNTQDQYRIGKKYWKYIKSKKRETVGVSTLKVNGEILDNSKGKAEALNAQFQSVFTIEDFQRLPKITENETSKIPSLHISTEGEPGTVTTLLEELNLTPLEIRRKVARITLFHKAIHERVAIPIPTHIIKPRRTSRLHQPNTKRYVQIRPNKDIYKYSFFPRTIRDWNKLPDELLEIESSEEFKTKLTKLLCSG
ncbi:unnamed protein product [Mytilus edulis]|uniref:PHD-type domain-containing protein n=1 Tax=Mytilus edulis TaxID=6550 RepID=A0A8S3UK69_MYTED|nr:unnamed protein product [Mytilus edulis]